MQVVLNEIQVSDLFFNYEKPALVAAYALRADDEEEMQEREEAIDAALEQEAESFSRLLDDQVSAQWLVKDFRARV